MNTASRLCGVAKGGEVLAAETTVSAGGAGLPRRGAAAGPREGQGEGGADLPGDGRSRSPRRPPGRPGSIQSAAEQFLASSVFFSLGGDLGRAAPGATGTRVASLAPRDRARSAWMCRLSSLLRWGSVRPAPCSRCAEPRCGGTCRSSPPRWPPSRCLPGCSSAGRSPSRSPPEPRPAPCSAGSSGPPPRQGVSQPAGRRVSCGGTPSSSATHTRARSTRPSTFQPGSATDAGCSSMDASALLAR